MGYAGGMCTVLALIALLGCTRGPVDLPKGDTGSTGDPDDSDGRDTDTGETGQSDCTSDEGPALLTSTGCVVGVPVASGERYLGIPYAEPPVGALRFEAPVPAAAWDEPLDATEAGSPCLQTGDSPDGDLHDGEGDEDCLTLNVWRPEDASDAPLIFFIHGGNFLTGSGAVDDLAHLPTLGRNAVVVTFNARLGPFGYLAHPALSQESKVGVSGNEGVLDTLQALRWVNDNAENLGADPDRILVVGEESGGLLACTLLLSPLAEGLMDGVVLQSAGCGVLALPMADKDPDPGYQSAEDAGRALAEALSCEGEDQEVIDCLKARPAEAIRTALAASPAPYMQGVPWAPNVDGYVLPDDAITLVNDGQFRDVPIFAGVNADEGTLYTEAIGAVELSDIAFPLRVQALIEDNGGDPDAFDLDSYSASRYGSISAAYTAFYGNFIHTCPTRNFLRAISTKTARVYAYTFTHAPSFADSTLGVYTGAELPFLFGTHADEYTEQERLISAWLQASWLWALDDPPEVFGVGEWPDFEGDDWVLFGDATEPGVDDDPYDDVCDSIDATGWQLY